MAHNNFGGGFGESRRSSSSSSSSSSGGNSSSTSGSSTTRSCASGVLWQHPSHLSYTNSNSSSDAMVLSSQCAGASARAVLTGGQACSCAVVSPQPACTPIHHVHVFACGHPTPVLACQLMLALMPTLPGRTPACLYTCAWPPALRALHLGLLPPPHTLLHHPLRPSPPLTCCTTPVSDEDRVALTSMRFASADSAGEALGLVTILHLLVPLMQQHLDPHSHASYGKALLPAPPAAEGVAAVAHFRPSP
jgi:hypothetical protein